MIDWVGNDSKSLIPVESLSEMSQVLGKRSKIERGARGGSSMNRISKYLIEDDQSGTVEKNCKLILKSVLEQLW